MSREVDRLATILSDPANSSRTAEELAQLVLDETYALALSAAKAEIRAETRREILDKDAEERRLAVVGQISYGPQEAVHTVVLGPFRSPLRLSSEERFQEALKRPCTAAREAGNGLAWDSKSQTGHGRWMLAPAFIKPRQAWDFFRPPKDHSGEPMNLLVPPPPHIAEAVARWRPGLWADEFGSA